MKIFNEIGVLILTAFILSAGLCYGQSNAGQIYSKGRGYGAQGEFKKAREEFEKSLKVNQFFQPAKGALEILNDVVDEKIEDETAILLFKGESYASKRYWDKALSSYNKAIKINPKYAKSYGLRGYVYFYMNQYDKSFSDFDMAIELSPMDAFRYNTRGYFFNKLGKYDRSISDNSKAIEINPMYAEAYVARGFAYYKLENYINACTDWRKASDLGNSRSLNWAIEKGFCTTSSDTD